jgi:hypothetical protein
VPTVSQNKPSTVNGKINHMAGVIYITHLTCIIFVISLTAKERKIPILTHNAKNSVINLQVLHQYPATQTRKHLCSSTIET